MTDTMRRPTYGDVGVALGPDRPISRTAPPHPRRMLQPVERRPPVTAPRRPFRVRIFCNGDRYFKVRSSADFGPNSTTRTPAIRTCSITPPTDTNNGRAHNDSTTNLPHRNARAQHLDTSRCWDVANFFLLVVTLLYNKL